MIWISKYPPQYIWPNDIWIKEPDYTHWIPDITKMRWLNEYDKTIEPIPFPKKTIVKKLD